MSTTSNHKNPNRSQFQSKSGRKFIAQALAHQKTGTTVLTNIDAVIKQSLKPILEENPQQTYLQKFLLIQKQHKDKNAGETFHQYKYRLQQEKKRNEEEKQVFNFRPKSVPHQTINKKVDVYTKAIQHIVRGTQKNGNAIGRFKENIDYKNVDDDTTKQLQHEPASKQKFDQVILKMINKKINTAPNSISHHPSMRMQSQRRRFNDIEDDANKNTNNNAKITQQKMKKPIQSKPLAAYLSEQKKQVENFIYQAVFKKRPNKLNVSESAMWNQDLDSQILDASKGGTINEQKDNLFQTNKKSQQQYKQKLYRYSQQYTKLNRSLAEDNILNGINCSMLNNKSQQINDPLFQSQSQSQQINRRSFSNQNKNDIKIKSRQQLFREEMKEKVFMLNVPQRIDMPINFNLPQRIPLPIHHNQVNQRLIHAIQKNQVSDTNDFNNEDIFQQQANKPSPYIFEKVFINAKFPQIWKSAEVKWQDQFKHFQEYKDKDDFLQRLSGIQKQHNEISHMKAKQSLNLRGCVASEDKLDQAATVNTTLFCNKRIRDYQMLQKSSRRAGRTSDEGRSYFSLGILYDNLGQYLNAIHSYDSFLKICVAMHDEKGQVIALNCKGVDYQLLAIEQKSRTFVENGIDCHIQCNAITDTSYIKYLSCINLGMCYDMINEHSKAMHYREKAVKYANKIKIQQCKLPALENTSYSQLLLETNQKRKDEIDNKNNININDRSQVQEKIKDTLEEYLQISQQSSNIGHQLNASLRLGQLLNQNNKSDDSRNIMQNAYELARDKQVPGYEQIIECNLAIAKGSQLMDVHRQHLSQQNLFRNSQLKIEEI